MIKRSRSDKLLTTMRKIQIQQKFESENEFLYYILPFNKEKNKDLNQQNSNPKSNILNTSNFKKSGDHDTDLKPSPDLKKDSCNNQKSSKVVKLFNQDIFDYEKTNFIMTIDNYLLDTIIKNSIINRFLITPFI